MQTTITTCAEALARWNSGQELLSVSISGFEGKYEWGCQTLMFSAIAEQLEHAGDSEHWKGLHARGAKSDDVFPETSAMCASQEMTGAMWGASISAAVVMLHNEWAAGMALVPEERVITVVNP